MKTLFFGNPSKIASLGLLATVFVFAAPVDSPGRKELVEISGIVSFEVPTNESAVVVKAKSSSLEGRAQVSRVAGGLLLEQIDAWVPVSSLKTGVTLRDQHMRKQVFTASDGQVPDVRFTAKRAKCSPAGSSHEFKCQVSGGLSIRGVSRPFAIDLKVRQQGDTPPAFHSEGSALVKLSDYDIAPPSQFGVKVANEVKLHVELTTRHKSGTISDDGGGR